VNAVRLRPLPIADPSSLFAAVQTCARIATLKSAS
jgi:hypothetical protein